MNRLPAPAEVVTLWRNGWTQGDIARMYGVTHGSVRRRIAVARDLLASANTSSPLKMKVLGSGHAHREIAANGSAAYSANGTFAPEHYLEAEHLDLHDLSDLLSEWGVR